LTTLRLCAPSIQRLVARNWEPAFSGWALIASSLPDSTSVPTPFLTAAWMVVLMSGLLPLVLVRCGVGRMRPRGAKRPAASR
jgi:hypothetical protein